MIRNLFAQSIYELIWKFIISYTDIFLHPFSLFFLKYILCG